MIGLLLFLLSLCALATRASGHSIDGGLTTWTDLGTSRTCLPPTGQCSLHRRGLSIDLNEAPARQIDLNEMPDSGDETGNHAEGASLSHATGAASPREAHHLPSHPASPFSAAREFAGEPSSVPWMAGGRQESKKSAGLHPFTDALPMIMDGDAVSSNHAVAFSNESKEEGKQQTRLKKTRAYYNARWKRKRKLLGYKKKQKIRDKDRPMKLEEVEAWHRNPEYKPITRAAGYVDARLAEKKRLLGYKWYEKLREEHKGWKLEGIKMSMGLDPFVPLPSERAWKRKKNERGNAVVEGTAVQQAVEAQRKALIAASASVPARPGKRTRASSLRR